MEIGTPGNVRIRFVSGTKAYIQLPNEGEKELIRFQFGYDATPQSLLGLWSLVYANEAGRIEHDPMELTRVTTGSSYSSGMAVSYDGLFSCEQINRGTDIGKTQCTKFRSSTSTQAVRGMWMNFSVNSGEGDWFNVGSAGNGALYANRLMQASGRITGIMRNAPAELTQEQRERDDALRAALEEQAASR